MSWPSFVKRADNVHAHLAVEASAGLVRFCMFGDGTYGIQFAPGVRVRVTDRETVVEHAPPPLDAEAAAPAPYVPATHPGGGLAFDAAVHYRLRATLASLALRSGALVQLNFGAMRLDDVAPFVVLCGHDAHLAIQGSSYHMYGTHVHVVAHNATVTPGSVPSRALAEAYAEDADDRFPEGLLTHTISIVATGNAIVRGMRAYFANVSVDDTALVRVRAAYACAVTHAEPPGYVQKHSKSAASGHAAKLRKLATAPATQGSELDQIVAALSNVEQSAARTAVEARPSNAAAPRVEVLNTNACRPLCKTCWSAGAGAACAVVAC